MVTYRRGRLRLGRGEIIKGVNLSFFNKRFFLIKGKHLAE